MPPSVPYVYKPRKKDLTMPAPRGYSQRPLSFALEELQVGIVELFDRVIAKFEQEKIEETREP
jgi:hypothetical protein